MSMYVRYYRVAALPYTDPSDRDFPDSREGTERRYRYAQQVENAFLDALHAGRRPRAVLVAPERGTLADIKPGGLIYRAWAWQARGAEYGSIRHTEFPRVAAYVESSSAFPDPASASFAREGSVVVKVGRIRRLQVHGSLAPIAQQLANTYGLEVSVMPSIGPWADVTPQPPRVWRGAVTGDRLAELRAHATKDRLAAPDGRRSGGLGRIDLYEPYTGELLHRIEQLAYMVGAHFRLPVDAWQGLAMRYHAGAEHARHKDRNPTKEAESHGRTVSFSLMLSQHGRDFTGGKFETPDGAANLDAGDLIGFTSETPHRVRPVKTGERLVAVCFASQYR